MKKNLFILALAAIALGGVTSCSNSDDVYDPDAANNAKLAEYNQKFIETFGTPAADQDWGFGTTTKTRALTRTVTTETGGYWGDGYGYNLPNKITEDESKNVMDYFKNTDNYSKKINLDSTELEKLFKYGVFIQHVYGQKNDDNGTNNLVLDKLQIDGYDINNFNGNEGGGYQEVRKIVIENGQKVARTQGTYTDGLKLVKTTTTPSSFTCKANDGGYYLDESGNSIDGQRISPYIILKYNGSYYLGFDYKRWGQNGNQQYNGDGIYTNWIIKLSPAKIVSEEVTRVFAEDLGTIGDFDFNDVVFDVTSDGKVILQAAGGTLPLYLEWNGDKKEVHGAFGLDNTSTMVNTHAAKGVDNVPPVTLWTNFGGNAKDIKIFVVDENGEREIKAITGQPAAKFAVNKAIDWQTERHNIIEKYSKFSKYVTDTSYAETWYINDIE